ncbi:MAG TPA: hypothetical protein VGJ81_16805 [Thermoanaerobaculia bacterium]|jgi:hypothetical protein
MSDEIDYDAVARLAAEASEVLIPKTFGLAGGESLRNVVTTVRRLYHFFDPSYCEGRIIVFQVVDPKNRIERQGSDVIEARLQRDLRAGAIVEVLHNGGVRFVADPTLTAEALSEDAVVYEYAAGEERFVANFASRRVPNVVRGNQSSFALPAFVSVKDALHVYAESFVRLSQCRIFSDVWYDDRRLFLRVKPEKTMRRSLEQFLRARLRAQVMPEQNVDESHPVDIRVAFDLPKRLALIEIKWLGQSRQGDGAMATAYTEVRARSGADQLAGYLDSQHTQTPDVALRGYLVVIDARRRNITETSAAISHDDGHHYADRKIPYDPEYHITRIDFEVPFRMFAEPVCD